MCQTLIYSKVEGSYFLIKQKIFSFLTENKLNMIYNVYYLNLN